MENKVVADKIYNTLIIGPVSRDINIDCEGNEQRELGGAVIASGYAAACMNRQVAVFTKCNKADADPMAAFQGCKADVYVRPSEKTCSIQNVYHTPDKERRTCTSLGVCDAFTFDEISDIHTRLYHFAGLVYGDFSGTMFRQAAERGKVAVDVQCLLRHVQPDGSMEYADWREKREYLPYVDYLKTDAAEAQILTGTDDRRQAAKQLFAWGAREIMISHHTEILIYDGQEYYTCPIRSRNLSGRTGRGDTVISAYLMKRQTCGIAEALQFATALVSLKMETPGPFRGSEQDVENYIDEFYR